MLHHWVREKNGSDAEVDFLLQVGSAVVPVEVKAGATGTMKSLHKFLFGKNRAFGVKINGDKPSSIETTIVDAKGRDASAQTSFAALLHDRRGPPPCRSCA